MSDDDSVTSGELYQYCTPQTLKDLSDDDSVTSGELYQYCTPQTLKDHKPCQMMMSVTSGELYQYCTPQTLKDHKPCQMMIVLLQVSYTSTVHHKLSRITSHVR